MQSAVSGGNTKVARNGIRQDALVVSATVPATIEAFVAPQLPSLVDAGWKIHIVTSPGLPTGFAQLHGVEVHEIAMARATNPVGDLAALRKWVELLREIRPGVILGSTPKAGMLSMVAGRMVKTPRRIFLHRGARWETETGLQRRILMSADKLTIRSATEVLAVSNSLAALLVRERVARSRPVVLGNGGSKGVDLSVFTPGPPSRRNAPFTIGFVGRLSADKGVNTVLKVFDEFRRSEPETRLLIVGASDGVDPLDSKTLRRIHTDPSIEYVGHSDNVAEHMRKMDVLVFPSRREGLPNVVIEAAACGVPTVGWHVTGVSDAIADGISGRTVKYGDWAALVEGAQWVAATDKQLITEQCRGWAERFDQRVLTRQLVDWIGTPAGEAVN
jgi:glycosyltransferase involved in cell wall biosynthesis